MQPVNHAAASKDEDRVQGWLASHRIDPGDIHHTAAQAYKAEFGLIDEGFANLEAERSLCGCGCVTLGGKRCCSARDNQRSEKIWSHDDALCTGA